MFTDETTLRTRFQIPDESTASTALINASIEDAHTHLLRFLDPQYDLPEPDPQLVFGETLLAGAYVLRTLAAGDAAAQQDITIAGQRISPGNRFAALMTLAEKAEVNAWPILAPFLLPKPGIPLAMTTDTIPILGDPE
ncbi:MAG: hypothetical protein IT368_13755 [Candidatus Hydrogenedentes bacterium]|nr:hypothetical protein [Candidatus Hydrogenedentota bacterium]